MGMEIVLVTQQPTFLKIQMGWSKISLQYSMSRGVKETFHDNPTVSEAYTTVSAYKDTHLPPTFSPPKELLDIFCFS